MIDDPAYREGHLLRIFVGEDARWSGQPLHIAIVEMLRRANVAGASVFRGIEGFGAHHELRRDRLFAFEHKMPVLIEVVDEPAAIESLIPILEDMVADGVITLERVTYRRFGP